ncbi:MAG: ABC transporter substrate-binding protein, partial [Pseudomonadota bacterium]|nr:ABC transporter substrate-binding protein [Pseudomonadota bacterium]
TELFPVGPPKVFRIGDDLPNFEISDVTTVRFTWSHANRYFLQSLARSRPIYIYRPSHHLRQFHTRYNDKAALKAEAQKNGMQS